MLRLRDFTPAMIQHLAGYCELAKAAADEWRADLTRRLAMALAGVICAAVALIYGCTWLLLTTWNTPARNWVGAATCSALALTSFALLRVSGKGGDRPRAAQLALELERDRQLLLQFQEGTHA